MRIFIISAICLMAFTLSAQDARIEKANNLVRSGKADKAIKLLKKSYKKSNDRNHAIHLTSLLAELGRLDQAMAWSSQLNLEESEIVEEAILFVDLLIQKGSYQKAMEESLRFAIQFDDAQSFADRAYSCERFIKGARRSAMYEIREVPFNSFMDEISISNYRRNYIMSSNRVTEVPDAGNREHYFDLFMLKQDFDKWRYPFYLLKDRSPLENRTTLSFTTDGNTVFYTISEYLPVKARKKAKDFKPAFSIYRATSMGNTWVDTEPLAFQQEDWDYKDPAIHPDGDLLVFCAKPKSNSTFDLYFSIQVDGQWQSPVSLGRLVNSDGDETMPYFNKNGELFFSSNGQRGYGGYDIFRTRYANGIWIQSEILPIPLNSTGDDLSYTEHEGRSGGFITSNRPGGKGGFDIYDFKQISLELGVTVIDKSNGGLIPYAEVRLSKDGEFIEHKVTNEKGLANFRIAEKSTYEVQVIKDGYMDATDEVRTYAAVSGRPLYWNIQLVPDIDYTTPKSEDYIKFKASIVDVSGQPIPHMDVKLINLNISRMKLLKTDENGQFEQSLFLGNTYRIVMLHEGESYEKTFSTESLEDTSPVHRRYTIKGK